LGVKRWVTLMVAGTTLVGLGLAYYLTDIYRQTPFPVSLELVTLQFLSHVQRAILFVSVGLVIVVWAVIRLNAALLAPFVRPGSSVPKAMDEHRRRSRGPKIVAIGGGSGLAMLLRGLKAHTSNLTAIVTVADDGGSSGRLRRSLGVLPPGDFRNCLAALADDESLVTQLFQYRFAAGDGLEGHPLGNLFITAMAQVTGNFESALAESSRVLNIRGQVLPSTIRDVTLVGEVAEEGRTDMVEGESRLGQSTGNIQRVMLKPDDPAAYPPAIRALLEAELIVLGPGSLFTSLIPNLLVPDLLAAVRASRARKVYICNTATQPGETSGYTVADHVLAIERHIGLGVFDLVLVNDRLEGELLPRLSWVLPGPVLNGAREVYCLDLVDEARPWRHDPVKLATALLQLIEPSGAGMHARHVDFSTQKEFAP
jgi:uncharacterized cofD-like protein